MAALMVAGLPTHAFCFEGFLPRTSATRRKLFARHLGQPTRRWCVFESPHRIVASLADLVATLGADRPVAIARELTKHFEEVFRGTAADALAHFASAAPRGEFTLVIGGTRAPCPEGPRDRTLGLVDTHAHLMDPAFDADRADGARASRARGCQRR